MTTWLSDASANRHIKTYVKDFLDLSGNMTVRQTAGDYAWNSYGQVISGPYESDAATYFGLGVGMDVSGLTIVVGAGGQEGANTTDSNDGSVTVYRYDTTAEIWYQLGNTITGETNNNDFGFNVDINDAGTRIMATNHTTGDFVNVYDYNSGTNNWDKQVSITAHTVSRYGGRISGDGNTILFGDYTDNSNSGKQYIYRNTSGTTWTLIGEFTGAHTDTYAGFGPSISYDGNRITFAESNYNYDADGNSSDDNGRVTIYDYSGSGTSWNQVGDPIYGEKTNDRFGTNEDFSKDGSIVAIGAEVRNSGVYVKVYQYDANVDGSWKQLGTKIAGATTSFGTGVRLSDDGTVLMVSDYLDDTAGTDNGALYIYKYINGDWAQQGSTLYGQYTGSRLGYKHNNAIAISGDGSKIAGGGYVADVNNTDSGVVQAWQWSQKTYVKPALDISGGTMTMWGGAEHVAANYSVGQLGADIDEYNNDGAGGGERSNTLSFSSDGTTLYIGHQLGYNNYGERTGTFRVMKYRSGEWYKIGSTIAPRSSEVGVFQGTLGNTYYNGGGLSSDGTRAMGGWRNEDTDSSTEQKGLIRVYDLSGGDWVQVGNDIVGDSAGDLIAGIMSSDGNTVAYRDTNSTYAKIRTYDSSTNTWDLQTTISTGSLTIMSLSYDGTIRIDSDISTSGDYKLTAYKYANGSWSQIGQELKSYEVANNEAFTVSKLSKYGDYLLVGDQDSFSSTGVAIVYKYSSEADKWMQLGGNIQNPFTTEIYFATAGGISADGKTIVLTDFASRGSDYQGNDGAIAVYKYFDGNWTQIFKYDGLEDDSQLAYGAAMCDNGELFAVSSGGSFFARTYQITNNPALKIKDGKINDISVGAGSGANSIAMGISPVASAANSIAIGSSANATGSYDTAIGRHANATGGQSLALGYGPEATGACSIAIGRTANAYEDYSIAMGYFANATNSYATAIGRHANATGSLATGIGPNANATGSQSVALGYGPNAIGACSIAIGSSANASGEQAMAIGYNAFSNPQSLSIGTSANVTANRATAVGAWTPNASGYYATALGSSAYAVGQFSTAIGVDANAADSFAIAIGRVTKASYANCIAIGYYANAFGNTYGTAVGPQARANTQSTALGWLANANGYISTAIGRSATASGANSIAIGYSASATGSKSIAIGHSANTTQDNAIILGTGHYVGIGTNSPGHPLHITTTNSFSTSNTRYFRWTADMTYSSSSFSYSVTSIIALGAIGSNQHIFSYSDRRIKKDIVEIDDDTALNQIRLLKPSTYKYKDPIGKNEHGSVIGFIAQEVHEVIPSAVKYETGDIPNVMLMGSGSTDASGNHIITIPDYDTSTLELDASGNIFPKLKIVIDEDDKDKEVFVNIQEVISTTELKVEIVGDDISELPSEIFIYGQEVNDKHTIIKDKIFSVGISAMQEIDRQQQADKARIATLETQVADLLARVSSLESS